MIEKEHEKRTVAAPEAEEEEVEVAIDFDVFGNVTEIARGKRKAAVHASHHPRIWRRL